jgi:thermitase
MKQYGWRYLITTALATIALAAVQGPGAAQRDQAIPPYDGPVAPSAPGAPFDPNPQSDTPLLPAPPVVPDSQQTVQIGDYLYAADQILVQFQPGTTDQAKQDVFMRYGLGVLAYLVLVDEYTCSVPVGTDVQQLQQNLSNEPAVKLAQLNGIGGTQSAPLDYYYDRLIPNTTVQYQWSLRSIRMDNVWDRILAVNDSSKILAVLDNGINQNHEDLRPKIVGYPGTLQIIDVTGNGGWDDTNHGNFVSGIAGALTHFASDANPATGIAGVSPLSPILPVKVLNHGSGTSTYLKAGIQGALSVLGVRVINASLGNYAPDATVLDAIKVANDAGVLFVASVGNLSATPGDTLSKPSWPGAYWRVMAVGATDRYDRWTSSYSRIGPQLSVGAPGGDAAYNNQNHTNIIWSTLINGYGNNTNYDGSGGDGTSYSAPHVAGVAAVLCSLFPTMTWRDLWNRIEDTADNVRGVPSPGWDQYLGWGRLNADAATASRTTNLPTITFPAGMQLVSIPAWPSGLSPTAKTNDTQTIFGVTPDRVFWWDPEAMMYRYYKDPYTGIFDYRVPRPGPGRGYWVNFGSGQSKTYAGAYPYVKTGHPFAVHLKPGWNLIGCPATNSIHWSKTTFQVRYYHTSMNDNPQDFGMKIDVPLSQAGSYVQNYAYRYDSASGQYKFVGDGIPGAETTINPGVGYWIHAFKECELLIPSS